LWAVRLAGLLRAAGKTKGEVIKERKSAPAEARDCLVGVEVSGTVTKRWLVQALNMGKAFRVSRLVSACRSEKLALSARRCPK
jgi:hypothetical protein